MKLFNKNTKAGFTLVELIVVIAILGILAGVAIPVYSGYIKKANKAADLQLLGAVNTAVGAATVENDRTLLSGPTLKISSDKITGLNANEAGVSDSFLRYFGSNTDTVLKYYTADNGFTSATAFVYAGGQFYPGDAEIPAEARAAQQAYAAQVLQAAWTGSSFESAGTTATAGALSGVGRVISNSLGAGALSNLANMLDPESDDYNPTIAGLVSSMGLTDLANAMINSEDGSLAAVMYIADQTAGISGSDAMGTVNALLTGLSDTDKTTVSLGNTTVQLPTAFLTALTGDGDDAATNLGLAYAAATAFYNSDAYSGSAPATPTSLSRMLSYMMGAMNNSEFQEYIGTSQAATDLSAYTAAMGALSVSDVTSLDSDGLASLLDTYLGNN